jgi:pimeloyl-ACP methyl ester carboxylesterase
MSTPTTRIVHLRPDLPVVLTEAGSGRPALILHGGGGPFTVAGIGDHLAEKLQTITPTHPGWNGTPRPDWLLGISDIAQTYLDYLESEKLPNVLVIGSSLGGWIGAEMAIRDDAGRITGLVLIDAVGVDVAGEPIRDFFALDARGVAEYSYHDADRFYVDLATVSEEQAARQRANMAAMRVVAGEPYMHDPTLLDRLGRITIPVLVIWGDSDRIVTPAYGAAYAAAFAEGRLEMVRDAGHLPQIEQPAATFALIDRFVSDQSDPSKSGPP